MTHIDTNPSLRVLEETAARTLTFLRAIGLNPAIRATMNSVGYDDVAHAQGWELVGKASGFTGDPSGSPVGAAIKELSDWDGNGFLRIHAALSHLHPDQEAYVFEGLEAATGVAAVLSVEKLLERLDSLDGTGPDADKRKATAEADKKAIATLAARGIDSALRKKLREQVKTAQSAPMPTTADSETAHLESLKALRAWYDDWSETARGAFEKRGDLIKLGLAKRKAHVDATAPATGGATPPAAGATPPAGGVMPSTGGSAPASPSSPTAPAIPPVTPHA